ncbi:MAG: hypothetical protein OEX12_10545 [Gammaproteobacteria bacterium]|nr:hypothetical protein [Gammaproteobacteria bacterium]
MWEKIKKRLYLIILVLLVGIWFGYNIGQGRPFWTNPFVASTQQKIKNKAGEMVKDTKKVLRDSLTDSPKN